MNISKQTAAKQEALLVAVEDAVITYAEAGSEEVWPPELPVVAHARLLRGLAEVVCGLTWSMDEVRLVCNDVAALYEQRELERQYAAVDALLYDRQCAIPTEDAGAKLVKNEETQNG